MPRYIDADKLLRDTIYNPNHVPYIAESDIIFAPKADAVEVVRCKECEWHDKCRYEQHLGLEGFCSKGERRDDA